MHRKARAPLDAIGNATQAMNSRASRVLVLLPGIDGTDVFFRPLIAQLPRWIRPVVISYPQDPSTSYTELVELVRRATYGIPDMCILASSFAGPLAVMLAAAEPRRVRGLILCASF